MVVVFPCRVHLAQKLGQCGEVSAQARGLGKSRHASKAHVTRQTTAKAVKEPVFLSPDWLTRGASLDFGEKRLGAITSYVLVSPVVLEILYDIGVA